jgi:hypothetical protein
MVMGLDRQDSIQLFIDKYDFISQFSLANKFAAFVKKKNPRCDSKEDSV